MDVRKSQLAILMFVMSFTYKVSKLPSLISSAVMSEALLLTLLYLVLELFEFAIIYRLISTNSVERIKGTPLYKVMCLIMLPVFFMKLVVMSSGTIDFTKNSMFENITVYEVAIPLVFVVAYMAIKGIRTIARSAEITIWLIVGVLFINLIFLKGNPNFTYNLPIVVDFLDLIKSGDKYFFWFGDAMPFLFINLKGGGKRYIVPSIIFCGFMVLLAVALVNAMYGRASENVGNLIVRVASFNQFADKLGRLDWTGMIVWEILSLLYLGVYLWAFGEAFKEVFKSRILGILLCSIGVILYDTFIENIDEIIGVVMGDIRWYAVAVNYFVPVIFLVYSNIVKKADVVGG